MMKTVSNMAKIIRRLLKQFFISSKESTNTEMMLPIRPTMATSTCKMTMTTDADADDAAERKKKEKILPTIMATSLALLDHALRSVGRMQFAWSNATLPAHASPLPS